MKVYIISAVFPPEPLTTATTSADIAAELAQRGHQVTVFAPFPNRPEGKLAKGFKRRGRFVRKVDNYRIIHSWHTLSRESSFLSRLVENITFGITSTWQIIREGVPNVAYMNTWPIFASLLNSFVLKLMRVPIVCSVQDIYPESLIDRGMQRKNSIVAKIMHSLDTIHLKRCSKITTISPGMIELLKESRSIPTNKINFIPNWSNNSDFPYYTSTNGKFRAKHNIPRDNFVATFAGSLTGASGVSMYVDVAEHLRNNKDILLLMVGDGSQRKDLEREINKRNLNNIKVIYPLLPHEVPEVQAAADVLLLSLTGSMAHSAAPSKQVSYLFSGRPIIASIPHDSYPAQIVIDADCGFVVPPNDPQSVAEILSRISTEKVLLTIKGLNARKYAEKHFARNVVLPKLINIIENASRSKHSKSADPILLEELMESTNE